MFLLGIKNCQSCAIAKKFLNDIPYKQLNSKDLSRKENLLIKIALGKLNPTQKFPVVFNDDLSKMLDTKYILDNLDSKKIRNELGNQ